MYVFTLPPSPLTHYILDNSEGLAQTPQDIREAIERKHFLYAYQLIQNAERLLHEDDMGQIDALSSVRDELITIREVGGLASIILLNMCCLMHVCVHVRVFS